MFDVKDKEIEKLELLNKRLLPLGGVIMMLSYFPQIFTILKNKTSQGVSLAFISMVTMALATFTFNGFVLYVKHGDKKTLYSQLANLIPAIVTMILVVVYR